NFGRRVEKGKYIGRNSANYVALLVLGATSPIGDAKDYNQTYNNPMLNAGVVWGLQRNFRGRFSVDLNIGVGYGKVGDYERTIPVGEFNIGMWLGSKHGERKKNKRGGEWYE
ncbi:MAG TPA: hypothetical protein VHM26_13295, partial [Chitinophagaceae bacterium]|nr:hypothetical protein [Chitinophagaceae bacterium]